jgi:asparagine synthase (glutamine-hydrolysing)
MAARYGTLPAALRRGLIEPVVNGLKPRPLKKGLVNKAKRFVEGLGHDEELGHARWRVFDGNGIRETLFTSDAHAAISTPADQHIIDLARRASSRQPLNRSLYVDLKSYLCDNILVKVDRMSMAVSLEAWVPFLDPELVELAFRIPDRFKIQGKETKSILKKVAARHVPHAAVYRPKEGFSIPIKNWLKTEFRPLLEDALDPARIDRQGVFDGATVKRLKAEHLSDVANHSYVLWSLIVFQSWSDQWLKAPASASPAAAELVTA